MGWSGISKLIWIGICDTPTMTGMYICVTDNKSDVNGNCRYRGDLLDNETIRECSGATASQFVN